MIDEIDELVDELPDNTPRYVLVTYSMDHSDGRKSKPLFLVYWIPRTASTEMATLYVRLSFLSLLLFVLGQKRDGREERERERVEQFELMACLG